MGEHTKERLEKRTLPFKGYVDHDMGACLEDANGRLIAAFGYHPNGVAATDEVDQVCLAVNNHDALVAALKDARAYLTLEGYVSQGNSIINRIDAVLKSVSPCVDGTEGQDV